MRPHEQYTPATPDPSMLQLNHTYHAQPTINQQQQNHTALLTSACGALGAASARYNTSTHTQSTGQLKSKLASPIIPAITADPPCCGLPHPSQPTMHDLSDALRYAIRVQPYANSTYVESTPTPQSE
jgi:hypothetical protein